MSSAESGLSTCQVSLSRLLSGEAPVAPAVAMDVPGLAEVIARGGWPGMLGLTMPDALDQMRSYVDLLVEVDVPRADDTRRDPVKLRRLLQSLARNATTEASITSLARDVSGADQDTAHATVSSYLNVLERLMVVEDQPAWSTPLRSSATLRKAPKRHFVDPALAVAALRATPQSLITDLNLLGLLFESLVVRDLRVYGQTVDATIRHARDSAGGAVDVIVDFADGRWAAIEVKLGPGAIPQAEASLLRFARNVAASAPTALAVITGGGLTARLPSGVSVVPVGALTA
jgi:predicted AAA+ superfamily ATPase